MSYGVILQAQIERELIEALTYLWEDSTRAFVAAIVASESIHIDTGMSFATLLPLAKKVKLLDLVMAGIPVGKVGGKYNPGSNWPKAGEYKTAEHGKILGKKAYKLRFGTAKNPTFIFEFDIVVLQYYLHETGLANNSTGAWHSLDIGKAAFLDFFHNHFDAYMPKIGEIIVRETRKWRKTR